MIQPYIDVLYDDILRLYCKRGRASDAEYRLILKRIKILKEEVRNA